MLGPPHSMKYACCTRGCSSAFRPPFTCATCHMGHALVDAHKPCIRVALSLDLSQISQRAQQLPHLVWFRLAVLRPLEVHHALVSIFLEEVVATTLPNELEGERLRQRTEIAECQIVR